MKELRQSIDVLIGVIDKYTLLLLGQEKVMLPHMLAAMMKNLEEVFPAIIKTYEREELREHIEERDMWISELERISEAFTGEDRFRALDILYYETRQNLMEYCAMITEKGLVE